LPSADSFIQVENTTFNLAQKKPVRSPRLGDPARVDLARLRVAAHTHDGTLAPSPAARRAVTEAADALRGAGARVVSWQPPEVPAAVALAFRILTADGGRHLREISARDPKHPTAALLTFLSGRSRVTLRALRALAGMAGQKMLAQFLGSLGASDADGYWRLVEAQARYRERFAASLDSVDAGPADLIVAPAFSLPAYRHGASRELGLAGGYTLLYNLLGWPAGVVPVTRVGPGEETDRAPSSDAVVKAAIATERGSSGLPIGVQVIARPWCEHVALAAMQAIEKARGPFPAPPGSGGELK
jgi:fatty acid amide hydrolase